MQGGSQHPRCVHRVVTSKPITSEDREDDVDQMPGGLSVTPDAGDLEGSVRTRVLMGVAAVGLRDRLQSVRSSASGGRRLKLLGQLSGSTYGQPAAQVSEPVDVRVQGGRADAEVAGQASERHRLLTTRNTIAPSSAIPTRA